MYHLLSCDPPGGAAVAALQADFSNPQDAGRDWIAGCLFATPPAEPLRLRCAMRPGTTFPALRQTPIPLMSRALFDVLCRAGVDNLVGYAAEIVGPDGSLLSREFVAFNLIGAVHSGPPGPGPRLSTQRLDAASARGLLLFRVVDAPYALVVGETLRHRLEPLDIPGLRFQPSQDWAG
jgi:hypothetical protein